MPLRDTLLHSRPRATPRPMSPADRSTSRAALAARTAHTRTVIAATRRQLARGHQLLATAQERLLVSRASLGAADSAAPRAER